MHVSDTEGSDWRYDDKVMMKTTETEDNWRHLSRAAPWSPPSPSPSQCCSPTPGPSGRARRLPGMWRGRSMMVLWYAIESYSSEGNRTARLGTSLTCPPRAWRVWGSVSRWRDTLHVTVWWRHVTMQDRDCQNERKLCLCDGLCGMSCIRWLIQ